MSKEPTKGGAPGKSPGTKAKRKLTRSEKKQIAAAIRQARGDGKAHTAQQTIPYINLYPDGICRITEKKYSNLRPQVSEEGRYCKHKHLFQPINEQI